MKIKMPRWIICIFLLSHIGIFTQAQAASFRCELAKTKTEVKICANRSLNDADVKMATTYQILIRLVPMGNRNIIQEEQVKWLHLRNQCQGSFRCLQCQYLLRQQALELHMNRIYQQGPF